MQYLKSLEMSSRNCNDAKSLVQTAEAGMTEIQNMAQRIRELAVQGANGTLTIDDRKKIQIEADQIVEEITSTANKVEFNNKPLLNGTHDEFIFQISQTEGGNISIAIDDLRADNLDLTNLDYTSQKNCEEIIETCSKAIEKISAERSKIGAIENRFDYTETFLSTSSINAKTALSQILDTDMALEMSEYTKNNVLIQAGVAILSQANQRPNQMLSLLQ